MITFAFGGKKGSKEYNTTLKMGSMVYKLSPFQEGDLKRFAAAITRSCEKIVSKDYLGKETGSRLANDPMIISVYEDELPEVNTVWDKIKAFLLLAKDAGLEITIRSYQSKEGEELVQALSKVK